VNADRNAKTAMGNKYLSRAGLQKQGAERISVQEIKLLGILLTDLGQK
jgi:hypothetical protein